MKSMFSRGSSWASPVVSLLIFGAVANGCTKEGDDDEGAGEGGDGGSDVSAGKGGASGKGGSAGSATTGGSGGEAAGGTSSAGAAGDDPGQGGNSAGQAGSDGDGDGGVGGESDGGAAGDGSGGTSNAGSGGVPTAGNGGAGSGGGGTSGTGGVLTEDEPNDGGSGRTGPLVIKVSSSTNPAVPGQYVHYAVTIGNTSEVAVEDVNLLFRVPTGLQFNADQAVPASSACGNWVCTVTEEATWAIGTLAAGRTTTILFNPSVLNTVGDSSTIASVFRLSAAGLSPINVTDTIGVETEVGAELALGADADPAVPGQSVELSFDVGNTGAVTIFEGEIQAHLPDGLTAVSAASGGSISGNGRKITWPVASLGVGATLHRTARATIASTVKPGEVLNAQAIFAFEGGDPVDHWTQLPISVVASKPPLAFEVSAVPSPAATGNLSYYTATIANQSLRAVDNVALIYRVPRELQHGAAEAQPDSSACGNWVCTVNEVATFDLGTLAAGTSQTVSIQSTLVPSAAGNGSLITGQFALRATGVHPIHLYPTVPVNGAAAADLEFGVDFDPVVAGQSLTYNLDVGQIGAASLANTQLTASLPAGVTVTSISDGGTESPPGTVSWNLGAIAIAGSTHRSVTATVGSALAPATLLKARATLTYDGGAELDASSAFVSSVIPAPLPLSVTVDATPNPVTIGGRALYTTTITNTSAGAVDGISLLLRVPTGLQFDATTHADPDSSACGNWVCTASEEAVWTIGSLAPGASQIVTVNPLFTGIPGGSVVTTNARLTAANLTATINLQKTVRTQN